MSEGTRLGEFKENTDFNPSVAAHNEDVSGDLRATKMGQVSEFERDLLKEAPQPTKKADDSEFDMSQIIEEELSKADIYFEAGEVTRGVVRSIEKSGLLIDFHYISDGFLPNNEIAEDVQTGQSFVFNPGDEIDAYIVRLETKEGYAVLSHKRALYEMSWKNLARIARSKEVVQIKVTGKVEGGLVADYFGIKGFVPASQVLHSSDDKLENYLGNVLDVTVLQADRKRRKAIFSYKVAKDQPNREEVAKLIASLEIGDVRDGVTTSIKDFGVFVDIGGVEGLVHISEMSWSRINHPSELASAGDRVKVFVLGIDREAGRISLGMKQLQPDPWVSVQDRYKLNDIVHGTITRVVDFGAFMQIEKDLEGLVHISELADHHVKSVQEIVKPGDKVYAKVIKLRPNEQKIGLSLKGVDQERGVALTQESAQSQSENTSQDTSSEEE